MTRFIAMRPEQLGNFGKAEIAKWAPVVKAPGAKAADPRPDSR